MPSDYRINVTLNRSEAVYQIGSRIDFVVAVTCDSKPVTQGAVAYTLRRNLVDTLREGMHDLANPGNGISASLDEPGFVECIATFTPADGDAVTASIAAGVDPLDIAPSMPVPADFDAFWDAQLARLRDVPVSFELTPERSWDDAIECFDTRVQCVDDVPVSGYFARPRDAAPRSLPAVLTLHGAGVHSASRDTAMLCAQRNWLAMDINAHGVANGKPATYYEDLTRGELADYRVRGIARRETTYFVGMFLRVRRALDFLASQPEWDGRVLTTHGHSQGGYQSIAGAALDDRVTAFATGVPAGCDHTGHMVGRPKGWPRFADNAPADLREQAVDSARYVDAMNLITRTRAEAYFSVGCVDGTCNPVGVYAAYNNHSGPRHMLHCAAMGHASPPEVDGALTRSLMEHARRIKAQPPRVG